MDQIRIGIVGYGNLGRGVEYALRQNPDMALVGVFTRRPPSSLTLRRSCSGTTAACPTAVLSSAAAARAGRNRTGPWWNSG